MIDTIAAMPVRDRERFPARVRLLLTSDVVSAVGMGLTQPYLLVLLHTTYGLSVAAATSTASLSAVVSLAGNPLSGVLTDRFGGRATVLCGLAAVAAGLVVLAAPGMAVDGIAGTAAVAASGVSLTGFGWSLVLPAFATLLARDLSERSRTRVFTLQYGLYNAGVGCGAALGGLVVADPRSRAHLPLLWLAAAVTCVGAGGFVAVVRTRVNPGSSPEPGGYRVVLADRALWRVLAVAMGLSAAGYGVYAVGPSVLALTVGDPGALSWVSTVNCLTVVLGLPVALRLGRRWAPYAALRATVIVWALAWTLCLAQVLGYGLGVRVTLPVAAALVGVGELFMAAALPTLVNALAPDTMRGRYNALLTFALTVGVWIGPLLASLTTWLGPVALLFGCALVMLGAVLVLVRR